MDEDTRLIYVGPNILDLSMQKFQVYIGGLPPFVQRVIEKIPDIEFLIVPISEYHTMREKTERAGTNESRIYNAVKKEAGKLRSKRKVSK